MVSDSGKKVSVIISFLNEEKFLAEAVESVRNQDYTNWELLLVDDGSTDTSTDIAKRYAAQEPDRIMYVEHEGHQNRGLSASRNTGIRQATGELIALLDADDVWLPGKLTHQVSLFAANKNLGMATEASNYWYSWNDSQLSDVLIPVGAPPDKVYKPGELFHLLYPLSTGAAPCPSALMIAKAAFERSGYFEESFRKEFSLYEDQAFLSKMYLFEEVYISSACHNLYRQREESIVSQVHSDGKYHDVRAYYLDWLEMFLTQNKVTDSKLWRLVDQANLPYKSPLYYHYTHTIPRRLYHNLRGYVRAAIK